MENTPFKVRRNYQLSFVQTLFAKVLFQNTLLFFSALHQA
jgi:hypothetical protein